MRARQRRVAGLGGNLNAQGVDHGVPGHGDGLLRDGLAKEGHSSRVGGREVERHQRSGQPAVRLFGERRPDAAGSQPCLDVADGDAPVEAGQRCDQHGGGVALDQRHVRLGRSQPAVDPVHEPGGQLSQTLVGAHHVEVGVDFEAEGLGDLAEHLFVLPSGHDGAAEVIRAAQRGYDRGELDRLRAGAHEDRDVARFGQDSLPARVTGPSMSRLSSQAAGDNLPAGEPDELAIGGEVAPP